MNLFAFSSLCVAVLTFTLGNIVLLRDITSRINRLFFLYSLAASYWSFTFYSYLLSESYSTAYFWLKMQFLWPLTIVVFVVFIFEYSEVDFKHKKWFYLFVLVFSITLSFLALVTDDILGVPVRSEWGWMDAQKENTLFQMVLIFGSIIGFLPLLVAIHYFLNAKSQEKKNQMRYVLVGNFIPFLAGVITEGLNPFLIVDFPQLTVPAFGLGSIIMAFGILRHEMFRFSPTTAPETILSAISEGGFQHLSQYSFDFIYALNLKGEIVYFSPTAQETLEYANDDLIGKKFWFNLSKSESSTFKNALSKSLNGETMENIRHQIFTKQGTKISLNSNLVPLVKDKKVVGVHGFAQNLTELKKISRMKSQLEASYTRFIQMTSHELRTPLTIILGYIDFLEKSFNDIPKEHLEKSIHKIKKNALRLERLTLGVADLNQMSDERFSLVKLSFSLSEFITDITDSYLNLLGNQYSHKESKNINKNSLIVADEIRLRQALDNLLDNAIKNTDQTKRKITLKSELNSKSLSFCVIDNGAGIAMENIDKIFERFVSIPSEYNVTGSGIGLYITKMIIEAHDGKVTASSNGRGEGACFRIDIPIN